MSADHEPRITEPIEPGLVRRLAAASRPGYDQDSVDAALDAIRADR